jgi:predicted permease
MDAIFQELRHAARSLRKSPGFTAVAIITLALGMGANIAIFTLADALFFRRMSVWQPSQLVRLSSIVEDGRSVGIVGAAVDLIDRQQVFDAVCGVNAVGATVEINGRFAPIRTEAYTAGCFSTLGIGAAVGRVFGAEDDRVGTRNVAVLAYDEWVQHFGADPSVVGTTVNIEGGPFEIIGVAARGYNGILIGFPARLFWLYRDQATLGAGLPRRATMPMTMFARLASGTSNQATEGRLRAVWRDILRESLPSQFVGVQRDQYLARQLMISDGSTGVDYSLRSRFRRVLTALLIVSGTVLCIACVNLAGLLIARAHHRRHEMEVRLAIGASPSRLVRSVLIEGLLLLIAAVAVSIPVGYWVDRLLVNEFTGTMMGFGLDVAPSAHVWMFAGVLACISFVIFVIGPAMTVTSVDASALASASSRVTNHHRQIRMMITVVQVGLTVVLVSVGSTFVAVLHELKSESLGISIDRVIGTQLAAVPGGYQRGFSGSPYYRDLLQRVDALPHVVSSSLSQPLPMTGASNVVRVGSGGSDAEIEAEQVRVSDAFFTTVGVAILRGQSFASADRDVGVRTAVISQSLARALFGSVDVVDKVIRAGRDPLNQSLRIVGVVGDAMLNGPSQATSRTVYLNFWQADTRTQAYPSLTIRVNDSGPSVLKAIEDTVRRGGREYTLEVRTLTEMRDRSLTQERLLAVVATAYGVLGLAVVGVGLFGLISYSVGLRSTELGIRRALGAESSDILRVVVHEALWSVTVGSALGSTASAVLPKIAGAFLYTGTGVELIATAFAVTLLIITAGGAAWIPARRATQLDPMIVLRRTH